MIVNVSPADRRSRMTCPRCGRAQDLAPICVACGHLIEPRAPQPRPPAGARVRTERGGLQRETARLIRVAMAGALVILGLSAAAALLRARLEAERPHRPPAAARTAIETPAVAAASAPRPRVERSVLPDPPPPPISDGGREFAAPGRILDVAAGGGGRYLAALLAAPPYLAVFDAQAERWHGLSFAGGAEARIAADARRLFVATPSPRMLWSWDLETLAPLHSAAIADRVPRALTPAQIAQRLEEAALLGIPEEEVDLRPPPATPLRLLAAGSAASDRPVLVVVGDDLRLVDPASLQPVRAAELAAVDPLLRNLAMLPGTRVAAAPDGRAFAFWRPRASTPSYLLRTAATISAEALPGGLRYAWPSASGELLSAREDESLRLPGQGAGWRLEVELADRARRVGALRIAGPSAELRLGPPSEFDNPIALDGLRLEQRFVLIEPLKKLATLPRSDDRVVLRDLAIP